MIINKIFSLKKKKVIIVGGSRGIGKKLVTSFLKSGASVVNLSRSKLSISKKNFLSIKCDISNFNDIEVAYKIIKKKLKNIDVLINCSGITLSKKTKNFDFNAFKKIVDLNLVFIFKLNTILVPLLKKNGSIINISSIASYFGFENNPGYISSKSGLSGLTRSMAFDLSKKSIRVNNIVLGYIYTDMTKKSYHSKKMYLARKKRNLLNRWGKTEDVVGASIFLASSASSYITGSDIVVDGGWSIKGM